MTAYLNEGVPEDCLNVIRQGYMPGMSQDGTGVDDWVIDGIPMAVMMGRMVLYHHGPVVYMLRRKTAWIGQVDIFVGDGGTIHDAIRAGRKAIKWAVENTFYHRLEARSPHPMMPILAKRLGFELDGFKQESFKAPDGTMLDEYEVGLILRGASWQQPH